MRCEKDIEVVEAANQMLTIAILRRKAGIEIGEKIWAGLEMATMTTPVALASIKEELKE